MADYLLLAQYPKQAHVRDRNLAGLIAWSASVKAQPIPSAEPAEDWVRLRLVAERIPLAPASYVEKTIAFFLADPATATNIREYLSPWNSNDTETSLSAQIGAVISGFMPGFAALDVATGEIEDWYRANGFADEEDHAASD